MISGAGRGGLAFVGAVVAYGVVAGARYAVLRSTRLREERVQRWNALFRGGGRTELGRVSVSRAA